MHPLDKNNEFVNSSISILYVRVKNYRTNYPKQHQNGWKLML